MVRYDEGGRGGGIAKGVGVEIAHLGPVAETEVALLFEDENIRPPSIRVCRY